MSKPDWTTVWEFKLNELIAALELVPPLGRSELEWFYEVVDMGLLDDDLWYLNVLTVAWRLSFSMCIIK